MASENYQGWKNYETWAVALWLDNTEGDYRYWRERAEEAYRDNFDADEERADNVSAAAYELGKQLKREIDTEAELPTSLDGTMYADLLNAALSEVDWDEIAEHIIEALDLDEIDA